MNLSIVKKRILIVLLSLIILFLIYFSIRGYILGLAIKKISFSLYHEHKLELTINKSEISGFRTIGFSGLLILDSLKNTVVYADTLVLQVKLLPMLTGKLRFGKLLIKNFNANIKGELSDQIFRSNKIIINNIEIIKKTNYSKTINHIYYALFSFVPNEIKIYSANINFERNKIKFNILCRQFKLLNGMFNGLFNFSDSLNSSFCQVKGNINKANKDINLEIFSVSKQAVSIPYINPKWGLSIKFDTLRFSLNYIEYKKQRLGFTLYCETNNLQIKHKNIAPSAVTINNANSNLIFFAGDRYVELDSSSVITINHFNLSPYFKYQNDTDREIFVRIPPL